MLLNSLLNFILALFRGKPPAVVPPSAAAPAPSPFVKPMPAAPEPSWLPLCRPLVQFFESCCLRAYPDPASPLAKALQAQGLWQKIITGMPIPADPTYSGLSGAPWTCGFGSTGSDIGPDTLWTLGEATSRMDAGLLASAAIVQGAVKVTLTPAQFAAMVSIVNNVGAGRAGSNGRDGRDGIVVLANGRPSTLLRHLNMGDYQGAADQFLVWDHAGGQVEPGLQKRRAAERSLFLTGAWQK